VEQIAAVCGRFAVFDTFVSVKDPARYEYGGKCYRGRQMHEHKAEATREERLRDRWASLDNPKSFWITRPSLYNLLSASGFTSGYDCQVPFEVHKPSDRLTVVAIKGQPASLRVAPQVKQMPAPDWPDGAVQTVSYQQRRSTEVAKAVSKLIPRGLKQLLKNIKSKVTGQNRRDRLQTWNKGHRG
jgi:hypothetical protein